MNQVADSKNVWDSPISKIDYNNEVSFNDIQEIDLDYDSDCD